MDKPIENQITLPFFLNPASGLVFYWLIHLPDPSAPGIDNPAGELGESNFTETALVACIRGTVQKLLSAIFV